MSKERWVLVGRRTLSAPLVKASDPIRYGEVVEVEEGSAASEYVKNKTYRGPNNMELPMFYSADSHEAKVAVSQATGVPLPAPEGGVARTRRSRAARA